MGTCTITSPARSSSRNPGWMFAYYDTDPPTSDRKLCLLVAPAVADLIKPGFRFDSEAVRFDTALNFSVLELDFDEPQDDEGSSLPPDPAAGWRDPDPLLTAGNNAAVLTLPRPVTQISKAAAQRRTSEDVQQAHLAHLEAALAEEVQTVSRVYRAHYALLGASVDQHQKATIAQKLAATTLIPWYKQRGIALSDEDQKSMTL